MKDQKGKRLATWDASNSGDREVTPPPGFPPRTKPRSMIETDKRKEKEIFDCSSANFSRSLQPGWNGAVMLQAIPSATAGEKTKSIALPLPPRAHIKTELVIEEIAENEIGGAPTIITPNGKEKLTPITLIQHLAPNPKPIEPKTETTEKVPSEPSAKTKLAEFNKFVVSVKNIFPHQPATSVNSVSLPPNETRSSNLKDDTKSARERISSLLPVDFHVLVDNHKLKKLVNLSRALLQKDTSLSAEQVSMLKLIEEIPLFSKDILEIKELAGQVEKFFIDLESNFLNATSFWSEYEKSKEKIKTLQAELVADSTTLLREFNGEITNVREARHSLLVCSLEMKKKALMELRFNHKNIVIKLHVIVNHIKVANTRTEEWGVKEKLLNDRCKKILAKFAPLIGFTI